MEETNTPARQAATEAPVRIAAAIASLAIRAIVAALLTVISASATSLLAAVVSELNETGGMLVEGQAITLVGPQLWMVRAAWVLLALGFALAISHRAGSLFGLPADGPQDLLRLASVAASHAGGVIAMIAVYWPAVHSFFVEHSGTVNSPNPVALSVACIVAWIASVAALMRLSGLFAPDRGGTFVHAVALSLGSWAIPIPFGAVAVLVATLLSLFVGGLPAVVIGVFVVVALTAIMFTL